MVKLGCCAFNFRSINLEEAFRLVRYMGFDYVDVSASGINPQVDQQVAAAEPKRIGADIRSISNRYELELVEFFICAIFVDGQEMATNHPDPEVRKRMLQQFRGICQCAAEAGFRSVMGIPGGIPERPQESQGQNSS